MLHHSVLIDQSSIIWVLVADGERACVYRYHKHPTIVPMQDTKRQPCEEESKRHELIPVPDMAFQAESLKDFQVGPDGRGLKIGGQNSAHNTCVPRLDIRDEVKQNLVQKIATKLKHVRQTWAFDHLVVAAPPKILGALRQHMDASVLDCVIAEIDKDFTNDKNHALLEHLQETLTEARVA